MFEFFTDNELISSNQSGFKPGSSWINQLLCITHDINQSFDDGLETRAVFFDISKAFDKVWHEGLLHKLKQISGNLFNINTDFLTQPKKIKSCFERAALNMVNSETVVPQGSILGPLFFLIYFNGLSDIKWLKFKYKIIYGWYSSFLCCLKHQLNNNQFKQWFK